LKAQHTSNRSPHSKQTQEIKRKCKAFELKKTLDDSCISQKAFDLKSKIEALYRSSI
jgi:hypothetical protein